MIQQFNSFSEVTEFNRVTEHLKKQCFVKYNDLINDDWSDGLSWEEIFGKLFGKTLVLIGEKKRIVSYTLDKPVARDMGFDLGRATITIGQLAGDNIEIVPQEGLEAFIPYNFSYGAKVYVGDNPLEGRVVDTLQTFYPDKSSLKQEHIKQADYVGIQNRINEVALAKRDVQEVFEMIRISCTGTDVCVVDMQYRLKTPESIALSLQRGVPGRTLDTLGDINGFRIIVPNIEDCYAVNELLEINLNLDFGKGSDDMILFPKPNGFQVLITKYARKDLGLNMFSVRPIYRAESVEFQIQTKAMYERAKNDGYR